MEFVNPFPFYHPSDMVHLGEKICTDYVVRTVEVKMQEGDEIEKIGKMILFLRDRLVRKLGVEL